VRFSHRPLGGAGLGSDAPNRIGWNRPIVFFLPARRHFKRVFISLDVPSFCDW
jgi:hypothetical protein